MSSSVDALYITKYNPFKFSAFLASFYSEVHSYKENLILSQLVIPLCSHPVFLPKLTKAKFGDKIKSNIWTIFSDRTQLYDLQERLDNFRVLTDQCLQYCLVNDWLEIDVKRIAITPVLSNKSQYIKQKSATNLGKLFSHHTVREIYPLLGVTPR